MPGISDLELFSSHRTCWFSTHFATHLTANTSAVPAATTTQHECFFVPASKLYSQAAAHGPGVTANFKIPYRRRPLVGGSHCQQCGQNEGPFGEEQGLGMRLRSRRGSLFRIIKFDQSINLVKAILFSSEAQGNVKHLIIAHCFEKAGFSRTAAQHGACRGGSCHSWRHCNS